MKLRKISFEEGKYKLVFEINHHNIIINIYFYENNNLKDQIEEYFIVNNEKVKRLKNIISNFSKEKQKEILDFIRSID